jgi:hypothetical protein
MKICHRAGVHVILSNMIAISREAGGHRFLIRFLVIRFFAIFQGTGDRGYVISILVFRLRVFHNTCHARPQSEPPILVSKRA